MEQKTKIYPSTPLENNNLEQRIGKKLKAVNSFNNSINNIKEMIIYFKDKNHKSKKKYKKYKMITTKLKSFDTFVIIATTSSSIRLSFTGIGLIVIPISTGLACGLTISNKVIYEIVMQKYNKYNKHYQKDQQTIKSFDSLYRNSLRDNVIDKIEYESLCNIFTKYLDETEEMNFLNQHEHKNIIKSFQ